MVDRDDPYKKEAEGDDNMMEKLWADPRLHGGAKRRIGTDDSGKAIFAGENFWWVCCVGAEEHGDPVFAVVGESNKECDPRRALFSWMISL